MQIIQGTTEFELEGETAAAIGNFDGIHLGHQKLLRCILGQKEHGRKAAVFTFDPPPAVLFGAAQDKELMTREEKRAAFEKMGIDVLVEFPLNRETAAIRPENFITEMLAKKMHTVYVAAGADVTFGNRGEGNAALLGSMAEKYGYEVHIIDKVCYNGKAVSSTEVRRAVEQGRMEEASCLLGGPYAVQGAVMHGNQYGRTMGMPTVNLLPPAGKLLPPNGVYYSSVLLEGRELAGITNIGYKPTVSEKMQIGVETYIYDFDREIYGREIKVSLLGFRRPERKFHGRDELKEQIARDIEEGRQYHALRYVRPESQP